MSCSLFRCFISALKNVWSSILVFSLFYYIFILYFSSLEDDLLYIAYTDMMAKVQIWWIWTHAFSLLRCSYHTISLCKFCLCFCCTQSCAEDENEDEEGKEKTFEVWSVRHFSSSIVTVCVHEKHIHRCVSN